MSRSAPDALARRPHRVELLSTVLLACAAVATAFSTYQSTRWRGEQSIDFSKATAARIQSAAAYGRAGQLTQIDVAVFTKWVNATVGGKTGLARFYRERFLPEFRPAFAAWVATKPLSNAQAPPTPFAMPQYRVADAVTSERLNLAAGAGSAAAARANDRANDYVLAVVLFAAALFFAGISTKLEAIRQRETLLAIGWTIFLGTVVWILVLAV